MKKIITMLLCGTLMLSLVGCKDIGYGVTEKLIKETVTEEVKRKLEKHVTNVDDIKITFDKNYKVIPLDKKDGTAVVEGNCLVWDGEEYIEMKIQLGVSKIENEKVKVIWCFVKYKD